jgi:methionyl-tRNA formyltransferase
MQRGVNDLKVLYFGDGQWGTQSLQLLLQRGVNIVGVVLRVRPTDPELATLAGGASLPVLQPNDANDPEFVEQILGMGADLNISMSYDQILRPGILASARLGFINFHAGKLPNYRGRNPLNWALINGEEEIGLSAIFIDEGIDTGDILLQRCVPVAWTDTYGDVLERVVQAFPDLVCEAVDLLANGEYERIPQAHLPGTYFPAREEGDEWLHWADSSRDLYNKIRAIARPAPGAKTVLGEDEITVWQATYDPTWPTYKANPGQVVGREKGRGVLVKTGDSTLLLEEIQVGGQPPHRPSWRIGTRLGVDFGRLANIWVRERTKR